MKSNVKIFIISSTHKQEDVERSTVRRNKIVEKYAIAARVQRFVGWH